MSAIAAPLAAAAAAGSRGSGFNSTKCCGSRVAIELANRNGGGGGFSSYIDIRGTIDVGQFSNRIAASLNREQSHASLGRSISGQSTKIQAHPPTHKFQNQLFFINDIYDSPTQTGALIPSHFQNR
jgi:hypothetical protein